MTDPVSTFPYNRIVQWAAGPVAAGVGLLVAWLATKVGIVAAHKNAWQHDMTLGVMFGVSALVTYAAHHKWLDNLKIFELKNTLPAAAPASNDELSDDEYYDPPPDVAPAAAFVPPPANTGTTGTSLPSPVDPGKPAPGA